MPLQFIIGNSGSGKSYTVFQSVIQEAREHPEQLFYVIVPEQFTMQTQKTLVEMHPDGGILNIDVLSFERLAFRVFEEVGGDTRKILEETGKNMVLQKLVQKHQKDLVYLKNQMKDIHFQRLISIDCFRTMVWQRIVRQSIVILRH